MTRKEILLVILILVVGLTGTSLYRAHQKGVSLGFLVRELSFRGPAQTFTEERVLDAGTAEAVSVKNSFGRVAVRPGEKGTIRLVVEKVIYTDDTERAAALAGKLKPVLEQTPTGILASTTREELSNSSVSFQTNLSLEIPASLPVTVVNRHGDVTVEGREASVEIDAEHGRVGVSAVGRDVVIRHEHGEVALTDIRGAASLRCEHGEIALQNINGNLEIVARHCPVRADTVNGRADVETTSESVALTNLGKYTRVRAENSTVTVRSCAASVEVMNSFDPVTISDVGGGVTVDSKHADISLVNIGGNAGIATSYGSIELADIRGKTRITAPHSSVDARGIFAGGRIETSFKDVTLQDLAGPLDAAVDHGGFSLARLGASGELKVETSYGNITVGIEVPETHSIRAESSYGNIQIPEGPFSTTREDHHEIVTGGSGSKKVDLFAKHGDVTIEITAGSFQAEAPGAMQP
jgi:DUF4097 and DUF4098 domain-containing protein YvlB